MATFAHPHPFDPTYGYDGASLLRVAPPDTKPHDFAAFWQATYQEAMEVPLGLTRKPLSSPNPSYQLEHWEFNSLGGYCVGAWYVKPLGKSSNAVKVVGHGYGGREAPDFGGDLPALFPCMPGFHLSARSDLPATSEFHVVRGIENKETYLLRFCVAALWASATALLSVHPEASPNLYYEGGSFGGGLGALMLPWDARFKRGYLSVPTFGHHPLRLSCPCSGSGEAVRRYHRLHPEVVKVLAYYDAATAAQSVFIPMVCAAALFDPAVPPPGQFAVATGLAGPKIIFIQSAGHHEDPCLAAEQAALLKIVSAWFDPGQNPGVEKDRVVWGRDPGL